MAGGLVATSMARSLLMPAADESPAALLARPRLRVPPAGDAAVMDEMLDMLMNLTNPNYYPNPSPSPTVLGPNDIRLADVGAVVRIRQGRAGQGRRSSRTRSSRRVSLVSLS